MKAGSTAGTQDPRPSGAGVRRALVEEQVRQKAAEVFALKGVANTSLGDIAAALGTGRTALYHYYASKDALVLAMIEESAAEARDILHIAAADGAARSATERLHDVVRRLTEANIDRPERTRLLETVHGLPAEAGRLARSLNRTFFTEFQELIRRGIDAGEFRAVDEGVAAHLIVGSIRSVTWWYDPEGPRPREFVGRQVADMAVRSLLADPPREIPAGVENALAGLRSGLEDLHRSLRGQWTA